MRQLPAISIYGYVGGRQPNLANFFWGQSIGIVETNFHARKNVNWNVSVNIFSSMKIVGATGVRVGVASSRNKLALGTRLRNLNLKSQFPIFDSFRDIRVQIYDFLKFMRGLWALKWAWQIFFWVNQ